MKLIYKLQKFMIGRYGVDQLYNFLLKLYVSIFLINIFINSRIINFIELLMVLIMFYRVFSKNIYSRRRENAKYLQIRTKALNYFNNQKKHYNDRKYHVYKKCHKCKVTLKLPIPSKRGIQHTRCPKCKNKIKFFCLRQQKVEIIKSKKRK